MNWPEHAIIEAGRNFVVQKEKITLNDALYIWSGVDTPGFRLVRVGNYPSGEVEIPANFGLDKRKETTFPVVEILQVKL